MSGVLVTGMAAIDLVMQVDALPAQATKYRASNSKVVGGGCGANAAVAIARLGGRAVLVSRLGGDRFGEIALCDLECEGVDCAHVCVAPDGRSPVSSVLIDAQGERQIVNFRGEGLAEAPETMPTTAAALNAVLVDTRWAGAAHAALEFAQAHGLPGIVDVEPPIPPGVLEKASHVAFSRSGLCRFSDTEDLPDALVRAARALPGWVAVTDGANGTWVSQGGRCSHIPAFTVAVVDTLGAGDVWHGAFALRLGEGANELEAVRFANAAAALKCMGFGGRRAAPDRAATESFLRERQ